MKIAIWHNLPTGGGLRALGDQVRGLAQRGYEIQVWSPPVAASPDVGEFPIVTHSVPLRVPPDPSSLAAARVAWRRRRSDLDAFMEHCDQCSWQIAAWRPDVVLAHPCQTFRVPAVASYVDIPSVLYLQEPTRRLYEATSGAIWAAWPVRDRLTPAGVRRRIGETLHVELARIQVEHETRWVNAFDEVLANSFFSRESILRAYGRDARVCRLGIDPSRFPLADRSGPARGHVLSVGGLVREKNIEFILRALQAAAPHVTELTWVANNVLSQDYRHEVAQLAKACAVPLNLRIGVTHEELIRHYAEADLFVYAPRLEPFGYAPLEAGSTGLPVVTVAEGGVRETVVDGVNGIVTDADPALFGEAVATLLSDSARLRALGSSAHAHVVDRWAPGPAIDALEARLRAVASAEGGGRVPPT